MAERVTKKEQQYYRTLYRVQRDPKGRPDYYQIEKHVGEEVEDIYEVIVRPSRGTSGQLSLWCSCMGFGRQHAPRIQHKHIRLVLDYQRRNEPEFAIYRLRDNEPRFQGAAP